MRGVLLEFTFTIGIVIDRTYDPGVSGTGTGPTTCPADVWLYPVLGEGLIVGKRLSGRLYGTSDTVKLVKGVKSYV